MADERLRLQSLTSARSVESLGRVVEGIGIAIIAVGTLVGLILCVIPERDGLGGENHSLVGAGLLLIASVTVQGVILILLGRYASMRALVVRYDLDDQSSNTNRVVPQWFRSLGLTVEPDTLAVLEVTEGGIADKAGLELGDVIQAMQGAPVASARAILTVLQSVQPGEQLLVTVLRGGMPVDCSTTV